MRRNRSEGFLDEDVLKMDTNEIERNWPNLWKEIKREFTEPYEDFLNNVQLFKHQRRILALMIGTCSYCHDANSDCCCAPGYDE